MPEPPGFDNPPEPSERRHLTVLFCDVVGSTTMSDGRDVEATFAVLSAYHHACRQVIERHGGVIAQYLGDGIFGWFGYPRPRDDDAVRAVRAGLDLLAICDELSVRLASDLERPLAARVGVHAGEVLVAPIERTGSLTAYGHTPNVAAKMQQSARPGSLVVSETVLRLVKDSFQVTLRDPAAMAHAGMPGYEVVKEWRPEGRVSRGRPTPFVGRDRERDRLRDVWASVRDGAGASVAIVGGRGIGKTRLASEVLSWAEADQARVLDCTCSHLHTNTPNWPFRVLLAETLGVEAGHTPAEATGLLRDHVIGSLGLRPESVPLLGGVLGLPKEEVGGPPELDPSKLAQLTTELLVEWVTGLAAGPTAILVDDVTDADPSSLTVLELLVRNAPPGLLLLFTVRSDATAPSLLAEAGIETMELPPLDASACATLIDEVSGGRLDERQRQDILDQSDGIPLFLEELARTPGKGTGTGLPITLTEHLQARLLAPSIDREVAEVLAVASTGVREGVLAAVLDAEPAALRDRVGALLAGDLVVRSDGPIVRYQFRHGLIAEAAYGLLLRDRRAHLHGRLADVLIEHRPAGARVDWDVVGKHLTLAGRPLDAFGAIATGANEASQAGAYREALRGYEDALDVHETVTDANTRERLEILCRVAKGGTATAAGGFGSDEAAREFDRCAELCRRLGPSPEHLSAIVGMQSFYTTRGEPEKGRRICAEIQSWVEAGHEQYRADYALLVGLVDFFEGEYRAAEERIALAVEEHAKHPRAPGASANWLLPYDPVVIALLYDGNLHWIAGRAAEGRAAHERAITTAERVVFPAGTYSLAYIKSYQGWLAAITGDHHAGAGFARETRDLGQRHGFAFWESCGEIHLGISEHGMGRADSLDTVELHAGIWELIGGQAFLPYVYTALANIRAAMGQHEAAAAGFDAAAGLAERTGLRFYEAERLRLCATALPGSPEEALTLLQRAWEVANRQGAWLFELRAALELARRTDDVLWRDRLTALVEGRASATEYPEIDEAQALLTAAH
jgi:class 3 adenylate cyclase/tetratricopeptide (TPR) repeat protein